MNLTEQLDEALRLEALATEGPWIEYHEAATGSNDWANKSFLLGLPQTYRDRMPAYWRRDAAFIAAARNILRPLGQAYKVALTALEASYADRETLKHRLDGVYGALADAASVVVVTDDPGQSVRELTAERDKLRAELAQQIADACEADTAIRKLCGHVDDGYTVPLVEVVGRNLASMAQAKGYAEGRAMGLEWRVKELEATLESLAGDAGCDSCAEVVSLWRKKAVELEAELAKEKRDGK